VTFEIYCRGNKIPDDELALRAMAFLDASTMTALGFDDMARLPESYAAFRLRLENHYYGYDSAAYYSRELHKAAQHFDESVEAFSVRVRTLARLANRQCHMITAISEITCFVNGLRDELVVRLLNRALATDRHRIADGLTPLLADFSAYVREAQALTGFTGPAVPVVAATPIAATPLPLAAPIAAALTPSSDTARLDRLELALVALLEQSESASPSPAPLDAATCQPAAAHSSSAAAPVFVRKSEN
jgi:hypothetical protein